LYYSALPRRFRWLLAGLLSRVARMLFRLRYLPKPQFPSKQSPVRPPLKTPAVRVTNPASFSFQVPRTTPDDTIRKATADDKITPAESLQMKHDSTNLDLRVLAGEVTHTLSLVWTAKEGTLVRTHRPMCPDGGGSRIDAYFFDSVASSWRKVHLQRSSCSAVLEENVSPAAIELVRWVHQRSDELEAHW
jgi:hypothetical protein